MNKRRNKTLGLINAVAKPNTLATTWGYLMSLLRALLPRALQRKSIANIYNYLSISENLATSGQPTEAQLAAIKRAGFNTVINLAPADVENALADEAAVHAVLGSHYIHLPVDFKKPTEHDFEAFVNAMQQQGDEKIWVHCAANMRVSAFIYRYRCEILGVEKVQAEKDLLKIWTPFGPWKTFIDARR